MASLDAPDLTEAQRFLTLLDESADKYTFQLFTDAKPKPNPDPLAAWRNGSLDRLRSWLVTQNQRGAGVFVSVNETDDVGRGIVNIVRVRAVWQEDDGDGKPLPLEPHFVVESSPNKFHRYLLCDGLCAEDHRRVQEVLVTEYGSDPNAADVSRVLRVPGFIHRKGEPFRVRILSESGAQPYTAAQIFAAFPPRLAVTNAPGISGTANATPEQITHLRSALNHLRSDKRVEWIKNGARLRGLGDIGRGLWIDWAQQSAKWQPSDAQTWDTIGHDHTGYLSIFNDAQSRGWINPLAKGAHTPGTVIAPITTCAAELLKREFAPVQWAVKGIIPEGVTILSGDPKIGKSWFVYQAGIAVATGSPIWLGREPEQAGEVLLLALEDNDRRMQRRLRLLLPHFTSVGPNANGKGAKFTAPNMQRLHYTTQWPRAETGVARLAEWMRGHPGVRLVVIDTVSAFRDPEPGRKSAYATDYAVGEMLKPLSREFSAAIVLVMHNRKMASNDPLQMVSGTQGMTGGVDNVLVLRRERGRMDAGLFVDGRDIEEPQELAMRFKDAAWYSDGKSVEDAKKSKERVRVLAVVSELGINATSGAIAEELLPQKPGAVRKLLSSMVKAGDLKNEEGIYVPTHMR